MIADTMLDETAVRGALEAGPATLAQVSERSGIECSRVLAALRAIRSDGGVCATRARVESIAIGPVYWHLPSDVVPKPKPRLRTTVPSTGALDCPGGHDDGPRTALERLARLVQQSTWREPVGGRSTAPGNRTQELLCALAVVDDQLGIETAMAMATGWPGNWAHVVRLADLELADPRSSLAACSKGYKRGYRLKLMLYDSFHDLVSGGTRSRALGAKLVGMRRNDYTTLYGRVWNLLHLRALQAAREAVRALHDMDEIPEHVYLAAVRDGLHTAA